MAVKEDLSIAVTFDLSSDQFPHGWYFNRFRIEALGDSKLVTLALLSDSGTALAVNAFVISKGDLGHNRSRSGAYLKQLAEQVGDPAACALGYAAAPARVYPINHMNMSRIEEMAEIGLYRYSVHTLLSQTNKIREEKSKDSPVVPCYPVVMFRCDLKVQLALIMELFS